MSWTMALFTFLNSWWICLFIALPFSREDGEKQGIAYQGAPARFHWKKAAAITTAVSLLVTGALALVINGGLFTLDDL